MNTQPYFFTLPLLSRLMILPNLFSSVPSVISMQMSSSLHYPDCDCVWFCLRIGSPTPPSWSLKQHFPSLLLPDVTSLVINLQHYCLFDLRWDVMSILLHSCQMGKVGWLIHEKELLFLTRKHLMYQKVTACQLKISLISSINNGHHKIISFSSCKSWNNKTLLGICFFLLSWWLWGPSLLGHPC